MNRHTVNNAIVSMAGVLGESNAQADQEIGQLQVALEQRKPVVEAARALVIPMAPGTQPAGGTEPVSSELLARLRIALRGCT